MVWRWWLSLLLGLLTMRFANYVLGIVIGYRLGVVAPNLLAIFAGMVVAHRTAPTRKWLSAVLVPAAYFTFGALWILVLLLWLQHAGPTL
jgi:hypothetical protein